MKTLFFFLLTIVIFSCKQGVLVPEEATPPRQLTWTADTLSYSQYDQTTMDRIWASSPNNVYMVGHCSDPRGMLYQFDGKVWNNIDLNDFIDGAYHLRSIYGFASNDIYIIGDRRSSVSANWQAMIVHFNGSTWQQIDIPYSEDILFSIWGSSPDDIWAGGMNGRLYYFDGSAWTSDSLPHPGYPQYEVSLLIAQITGNSIGNAYLHTYTIRGIDGSNLNHFYHRSNGHWVLMDSTYRLEYELWMSPGNVLYRGTGGTGLFTWTGSGWMNIIDEGTILGIHGPSDDNLFIADRYYSNNDILHYNGKDVYEFTQLRSTEILYTDVFYTQGHVFVVGQGTTEPGYPSRTVVWHGK
jgi:hypothetical protein